MTTSAPTLTTTSPTRAPGTPLSVLITVLVLILGPLIALTQIISYWRTDVVDDQMFAYFGWRIAHGATVYVDVWDNKPPGIYWVNALGMLLGFDSYFGVIAMCVLALIIAHAAFFIAANTVYTRGAAAASTILLGFFLMHAYFTGGSNRTETFLVACELSAVAFYLHGFVQDRWWKWYAAGLCAGLAFLFKQVGLAAWGCMGLHLLLLMITRELPLRACIQRGVLLVVGLVTTLTAAAAYLAAQGALDEALFATFRFNRFYFDEQASRWPYSFANLKIVFETHIWPVLTLPLLMAAAAVVHAFLWWLRPQHRPAEVLDQLRKPHPVAPRFVLFATVFFLLWLFVALYGAVQSPHAFRHYVVPSVPPLIFLAGYLINVLRAEQRLLLRLQQRAWIVAAFVIMGYFSWQSVAYAFSEVGKIYVDRFEKRENASWEDAAAAVARWSTPDQTVQCLGYMPGVYLHARRLNVSRYTTTEKIGQLHNQPIARDIALELAARVVASPPAIWVMSSDDYLLLCAGAPEDPPEWRALGPWLNANYRLIEEIPKHGTIYVFKRADLYRPGDPDLTQRLEELRAGGGGKRPRRAP